MLLNCGSSGGCNPSEITDATGYAASTTLPESLQADQASSGNLLLNYLFSTSTGYQYYPQLSQRQDFFQAFQNVEQSNGSQVVWPQVAANVSGSLATVNSPLCVGCSGVSQWVDQVGTTIMQKEWPAFQALYNGPVLTGNAATKWDTNMLVSEQTMLQPLYNQLASSGGWTKDVIVSGGWLHALSNIFNEQNRVIYGQGQLNDVHEIQGVSK